MKFTKTHTANRGTRTYKSDEGLVLYLPKAAGDQPDSIEVSGLNAPVAKVAKEKLSPEARKAAAAERRAANAKLTPAQKLEAEEKRIALRQEALARRKAKLEAAA